MNPSVSDSIFDHVFHDLVASVDDIVFRLDAAGRWTYLSDAWDRSMGGGGVERLGGAALRDLHPEDRHIALRKWVEIRRGATESRRLQVRVRTGSGSWQWMQGSLRGKWYADGRFRGAVGCLSDISALKLAEEELVSARKAAESANKAKSEFLSTMSHELRTPLNAVIGLSESLLEMGPPFDPERTKRYVTIIHQSGRQLLAMINDILDLARIEAGRIQVNASDFDLGQLLAGVLDAAQHDIRGKALRAEFPRSGAPLMVRADERLLRVVVQNLVGNAVKFTQEGEVVFTVDCTRETTIFDVRDTGPGIASSDVERIFQPFQRTNSGIAGTGLGLTIARLLAELMGGELSVQSSAGDGSTFRLHVLLPEVREPRATAVSFKDVVGYRGPRRRILVADDQPAHRAVLTAMLEPLGFAVDEVTSGEEVLARVDQLRPDLLLLDLVMTGMDGLAVSRALRAAGWRRPIIMVSANAFEETRDACLAAGCNAFLPKPVQLTALTAQLQNQLALDWIRARTSGRAGLLMPEPPAALRARLVRAARIGHVKALNACIDEVEQLGAEFAAYGGELRRLAREFQLSEILSFVGEGSVRDAG